MCVGLNSDTQAPGDRCASTSNRNFENRQGVGVGTHIMSSVMAAAAAITGKLTDFRLFTNSAQPIMANLATIEPPVEELNAGEAVCQPDQSLFYQEATNSTLKARLVESEPAVQTTKLPFTSLRGIAAPLT